MQFRFAALVTACLMLAGRTAFAQAINWQEAGAVARAAVESHPSFRRIAAETRAARERVTLAGSYPNPMVMGGTQNQQIDLKNDEMMTMYMVGASQTFPSKRRREVLRTSAELTLRQIELEKRSLAAEIERDALMAWYDLAAADSQMTATEQVAGAVDTLVAAARYRYEVGTAMQADVIRAQLQRSTIDHETLTLTGRRRAAAARLLSLVGLPLETEIPGLHLPHTTEVRAIAAPRELPADHPALTALSTEAERAEQDIRLARLLERPDWNLEASYALRTEQTDMFNLIARIELPVRRKSLIEPRIREAIAVREGTLAKIEELRRAVLEDLGLAYEAHAAASRQLEFHQQVLVPQSKMAFESSLAAYQAGKDNFESVLSTETAYLRLEIDYYDYLAQHIKAIADFEAIRKGARSGALGGTTMAATGPAVSSPMTRTAGGMSSQQ